MDRGCDFETGFDEDTGTPIVCGRTIVCGLYFPGEWIPEAYFCEEHRPEIREI